MVEITNNIGDVEREVEKHFKHTKVRDKLINRISNAKDIKSFIKANLEIIKRDKLGMSNSELIAYHEDLLKRYEEIELKASVNLKSWKGEGELQIQRFPNFFLVREPRKKELDDGTYTIDWITHNIPLENVLKVAKALNCIALNVKIPTRRFANIWCCENEILKNDDDKPIFDKEGFNFAMISGCRPTYFSMYYPLKIVQHYGVIQYYKNGAIRKIKEKFDIQTEFI